MSFGSQLQNARKKAGLTQLQLAEKLSVSKSTVTSWECDDRQPALPTLKQIVNLLGVDAETLLEMDVRQTQTPMRLSPRELELIQEFRALDDTGKSLIETVLEHEYQRCTDSTTE